MKSIQPVWEKRCMGHVVDKKDDCITCIPDQYNMLCADYEEVMLRTRYVVIGNEDDIGEREARV